MVRIIKDKLADFRKSFFREKYRFDQGNAFLVFVNFSLLVISLVKLTESNDDYIVYYIVGGLVLTWLLGYFLDKFVKVQEIQERVILKRSPIWQENFFHHEEQDKKIDEILSRLRELEEKLEPIKTTADR